jgi:hypothetical protein
MAALSRLVGVPPKAKTCSNKEATIMVIVSQLSYPPESANQIAKRFIEAPPLPDFITRQGPYVSSELGQGVRTLSIYQLDNSRLAEGFAFVADYMTTFFGVPGFTYSISQYLEVEEALKLLGL